MSGDLRAKIEALEPSGADGALDWSPDGYAGYEECRDVVLSLIPEGAVLVTEETLARVLERVDILPFASSESFDHDAYAAAILRHLREGT